MTTIRATCPACGEVGLTPDEVELHVDPSGHRQASYCFDCPSCLELISKPADERFVRLLASGGVPVRESAPVHRVRGLGDGHIGQLDFIRAHAVGCAVPGDVARLLAADHK